MGLKLFEGAFICTYVILAEDTFQNKVILFLTKFFPLSTTYITLVDISLVKEFDSFGVISEKLYTADIFSTTYLPRHVNVVKEWPPNANWKARR